MESLTAFIVLAALVMRFTHQDRVAVVLFALALVLIAVLLRTHANDALRLGF